MMVLFISKVGLDYKIKELLLKITVSSRGFLLTTKDQLFKMREITINITLLKKNALTKLTTQDKTT